MSINACSINAHTINAACGAYSVLSSTVLNYTVTLAPGQVLPPIVIGSFLGGPVTAVIVSSGSPNGPGGTLAFTTDPGAAGNIYFGGLTTATLGAYAGQVRLYGTINFVTINFTIQVVETATGGGQQQHVHPDTKVPLNIFRRTPEPAEEPVDLTKLEQPFIRVEVELYGQTFGETLEREDPRAITLVTLSGFRTSAVSVNISDMKIIRAENAKLSDE